MHYDTIIIYFLFTKILTYLLLSINIDEVFKSPWYKSNFYKNAQADTNYNVILFIFYYFTFQISYSSK